MVVKWRALVMCGVASNGYAAPLEIGVAEVDITPPLGFPIATERRERDAARRNIRRTGTRDQTSLAVQNDDGQ
jgi:hypothetical protein